MPWLLSIPLLVSEHGAAAEPYLVVVVDVEDLHHHLVPIVDLLVDVPDPMFRNLGDVKQPFRARKNLDEGSEVHHFHHRPQIGLAHLGGGRQILDDPDRLFGGLAAGGGDVDRAVVFDVDLDPPSDR